MQDEPEAGPGFSCKMSLKASSEMLGIDHQHGRFKSKQPGADSGVSGRECARPVCRARTRRSVRLGGEHPGSARVRQPIDTVHQGDQDGCKGIYHINAVDQVTQWEIVAAVPQISEFWLVPVLEAILMQFPFVILGFHSDNGSEFINYTVARLLSKLLIEQTRSQAHHTGDNGLVECKNGAIIRKRIGFASMPASAAVMSASAARMP